MMNSKYIPIGEEPRPKWLPIGVMAVAACVGACLGLGLSMQSPETALYTTSTTSVTPAVQSQALQMPFVRQAPLAAYEPQESAEVNELDAFQSPEASTGPGWAGLAMIPLAAVAGFFYGSRKPVQEPPALETLEVLIDDGDWAMASTTGEASEAAPTAKSPVAVETSYAKIIQNIEKKYMKDNVPEIAIGDSVVVGVRIKEGEKERVQDYEGVVICMRNGGLHKSITVRAVLQGVGVERVFPLHAPQVAYVKVLKHAKVRRAKLFYLRERAGKSARLKQRFEKVRKA